MEGWRGSGEGRWGAWGWGRKGFGHTLEGSLLKTLARAARVVGSVDGWRGGVRAVGAVGVVGGGGGGEGGGFGHAF